MAYKGPDISAWQGDIDIKTLATQVDFFIFRAYAGSTKDKKVDRNVNLAIESGKPYGLYIYSYALNTEQAKEEAKRVIELANNYSIKPNFLVIDMEDADGYKARYGMPSNQTLQDICIAEGEIFENAGYYAMVYASSSWFNNQLAGLTRFDKWVAHWPTSGGKQTGNNTNSDKENGNNCGLWQFTSEGHLNGYNGKLDMNYCYRDVLVYRNSEILVQPSESSVPEGTTIELVVQTLNGEFGDGEIRKSNLGSRYNEIQDFINHIYSADVNTLANEVKSGKYGNGDTRKIILGNKYNEVQNIINKISNNSSYVLGLYVVNTSSGLNVRSGPGTNYGIKRTYINGTRFDTYELKGDWARTPSGWVNLKYCKLVKKY